MFRARKLLVGAGAALVVLAAAPADAAFAVPATESSSTVVTTGVVTVPTFAVTAADTATPPVLFDCWSTPVAALAKGQMPTAHSACKTDQIAGQRGPHTVGGVQFQAVDAQGSTTRTGGLALASGLAAASEAGATTAGAKSTASAASARLVVGGNVVEIGQITSASTISCTFSETGARYSFVSTSTVRGVKVNGRSVRLHNGTMDIPVAGSTLRLNASNVSQTGNVQQAATLLTKNARVVLGETAASLAPVSGNPCLP
jgi:hypothetical protein